MLFSKLKELSKEDRKRIIMRSGLSIQEVLPDVEQVIKDVERDGDKALRFYSKKFDEVEIKDFKVSGREFREAGSRIDGHIFDALKKAGKNIREFHERQKREEWFYRKNGAELGQVVRALDSVGCYIPGGRANYPSTVLMTVIPAKVAGVERIACVSPPTKEGRANDYTLVACEIAGIKEVYKIGGAQAIAALALGTESVQKVDKIVGPGNIYVTAAKRLVSHCVAIDSFAGPSEVLIIADETANADYIVWDMLAQAEHDINAVSTLVTTSKELARKVKRGIGEVEIRREARESMEKMGAILLVDDINEAIDFSNEYAPEHLQIMTKEQKDILKNIKNAGSIFLGPYTPVACGDYASGTNHVLPTMGFARSFSGLNVYDFVKFISWQRFDKNALKKIGGTIITLAEAERLHGHAESVKRRIGK